MKDLNEEKITNSLSKNGVTKPDIELSDFYEYLDPRVVKKIKESSKETLERISENVRQYEYDLDGAQNILDSID